MHFSLSFIFHLILHVTVPLAVAWLAYRSQFRKAFLIMLAGIAIDVDHLLVRPILDPERCSVGFHMLHNYWLCGLYVGMAIIRYTRLVGLGLVIHILLDAIECFRQFYLEDLLRLLQVQLSFGLAQ